ncbi:MAG: fused MFS/spermidine synthase, partial [Acidobacteriota bacterium]|nr:fused MFS/spermidine synthase [Acidobacteriota bacterium]
MGRLRLRHGLSLVGLMFVVTGGVGLLAEQSFEKLLGLLLGTSTPAGAVVLGVYFAGLSIGAVGYARWMRPRVPEPLLAYALLEFGVAAWSLSLGLSFDHLIPAGAVLLRAGVDRFWLLETLRAAVAAIWILPPTMLMGATFPAIADHLERLRLPGRTHILNRFYALNLLGAFLGALAGPYLVFPSLGVAGTLRLGALLDGLVAAAAFILSRGLLARRRAAPAAADLGVRHAAGSAVLIAVAGLSGLLFFALEVVWTHLIGAVLGNSVFAFAAMLANVLLGLLLGSILSTILLPARSLSPAAPALLFLLGACVLSLSMALWCGVPHSLAARGGSLETFGQGELLRFLHAAFLLVPSSVVLGMAYPALFRLSMFPASDWPVIAGRMAAANAAGCVAGALLAAFVFLPHLGSEASLLVLASAYTLSGLALGLVYLRGRARVGCVALAAAVLALTGTRQPWDPLRLTSGEHVYFGPGH